METIYNTTILYLEPVLDTYKNIYLNVLTLSEMPKGSLSKMTKQIKAPKLSSFQTFSNTIQSPFPNCMYILTRYPNSSNKNNDFWMLEEDIPYVFSYLQNNNYKIETELTKIMTKNNNTSTSIKRYSGNRKIICVFSYCST
jgi:hypothetical protein